MNVLCVIIIIYIIIVIDITRIHTLMHIKSFIDGLLLPNSSAIGTERLRIAGSHTGTE